MTCLVVMDFSARILSSLARSFEYSKDNGPSVRNLTLLFSYLCIFDVIASDLMYDVLSVLSKHLTELDVSNVLTIVQCCGMKLRGDDPGTMKDFYQYSELCKSVKIVLSWPRRWKSRYTIVKEWNLCLTQYLTLRTTKGGQKRILHTIVPYTYEKVASKAKVRRYPLERAKV
ncbi:hypothetical protein BRADI_2g36205v3 [Brachypodium distachyon]|uniref:MIF4G domain-containing protein n=1 Tax=Brachypodium distachyon TaxID=15368 RepID=I1HLY0_BRADI|nr:hypothetical protein BRADI_2g36205v3 [Brachypodium distachyon]